MGVRFSDHKREFKDEVLRILGKRCCRSCKYFDSERMLCLCLQPFSLKHLFVLQEDRYYIGSGCSYWE